ncbi:histidinol-phosphate transaminase [Alkalihalobacillus pseudalcaliphilus]|uniref:histidinol-phosphate transaminase n=1 Tax=Alkalihalobacillus pseudalcaliphilus TaxID=79884 RepID=UPI00064D94E9|nr:histidinol-phosphate transaminase [Alkalihalobacillus pseudalcaliphilus]KMK76430.1 histidinol-phosphate aminotransferase [Alkalihalobacillus pseudalcaliphilus]
MDIKSQLLSLPPYQPGKPMEEVKKELGLERVIKLASNENPYGASTHVTAALQQSLTALSIYPDGYAALLREKVANFLNVQEEQLIFGNGSDEVIQFLCRALLTSEDNMVTADPTFSQYKLNATIEGAKVKEVALVNGVHDLEAMLAAIDEKTKIVWVCNPNNPTGTYVNETAFTRFLAQVPEHVLVVSDEAYYEYVDANDYPETIPLLVDYPNLVVLRTFSKAYGLASLRIGYGVGNANFIRSIDPVRPPFNNTSLAHIAALNALDDQAFITNCVQKNQVEMKKMESFCQKHQLTYFPSETNFLLIDFQRKGNDVFHYLLKEGIIVRSGEALGYPTYARITIGTEEENILLIQALEKMLQSMSVPVLTD